MKYDELIKKLRGCIGFRCRDCELKNEEVCNPILMEQAADAIEELQKSKWIPVTERLPENGERVLAYIERDAWHGGEHYRKKDIEVGGCFNGMWHADFCSGVDGIAWMPLPEPPKEEKDG